MLIELIRNSAGPKEVIYKLLIYIFALALAFSIHEFMHAAVAVWLGDNTPKNMGRLTLNPIAHVDPMGTVLLLIAGFGWGKPVMYNPNNLHRFKSRRAMNIMVHLAGVTGNFLLAYVAYVLCSLFGALAFQFSGSQVVFTALMEAFGYTYAFSLMLLAFNLLPIPPLDGFHVLEELLPYKARHSNGYLTFQRVAPLAIWVVFILSMVSNNNILSTLIGWIQTPFLFLINLLATPFMMLFEWLGLVV